MIKIGDTLLLEVDAYFDTKDENEFARTMPIGVGCGCDINFGSGDLFIGRIMHSEEPIMQLGCNYTVTIGVVAVNPLIKSLIEQGTICRGGKVYFQGGRRVFGRGEIIDYTYM